MTATTYTDFFSPVAVGARRDETIAAYLGFLEHRNGTASPDAAFPHRERWLEAADASPVRYPKTLAPELFERNFARFDAKEINDPALRALLAFLKINSGEAYALDAVSRSRHTRPLSEDPLDRVERLVIKEEEYHTRILFGASRQFGLHSPSGPFRPPAALKLLIGTLVHVPPVFFHPVVLAAELGGLFLFNWLLCRVGKVFAAFPALGETLEARLLEVMIDEMGHVAFNRAMVGPLGLAAAKAMAPHVAHATSSMYAEITALGWTRRTLAQLETFGPRSLPEAVRRHAFFD
jgi:hypothetical protein